MLIIGIVGWIAAGLVAGFFATKLVNLRGDDPWIGIALAVIGAVAGGLIYTATSGAGITWFNPWSVMAAGAGAVLVLIGWHVARHILAARLPVERPRPTGRR